MSLKSKKINQKSTKHIKPPTEVTVKSIPLFKMEASSGDSVSLKDFAGKNIVLYFYPKDNTPGCTLEGQEFNKLLNEFKKVNAVVLGVSRDSLNSHTKFIDKCGFKFSLLSDPDEKLCKYFDVIKEKNMYGKKAMGVERSTFVINSVGKVILEYRKVKAEGHASQVLSDLKEVL
ncbi:MAG: peroxiredoxin [Pseudobdellovibrio sp.]